MADYFTSTSRRHRLFAPTPTTSQLKTRAINLVNLYVEPHLRLEARAAVRRMHSTEQVERFMERFAPQIAASLVSTAPATGQASTGQATSDHTYNTEYNLPHTD